MALIDKASLLMVPSTYEAGTLYNVLPSGNRAPDSTNQNSGYDQTRADFTFDRGSNASATRIGSDGLIKKYRENLLLQSNQFDTTWNLQNLSVASGQSGYDGSNDAWKLIPNTSNTYHRLTNAVSGAANSVVTLSVYAKADGYNFLRVTENATTGDYATFNLSDGSVSNSTSLHAKIESVGNGWYRCSSTIIPAASHRFDMYVMDSASVQEPWTGNGTSGVLIQNAQLEKGLVATDYLDSTSVTGKAGVLVDLPRINYDANGQNGALLLEPSRQNLITQSEYFGASYWTKNNASVTDNAATSPEGLNNACLFAENTATSTHEITKSITNTLSADYSISIFAKANTRNWIRLSSSDGGFVYFNLATGEKGTETNATGTIEPFGDGWYKCSIVFEALGTNGSATIRIAEADGVTSYTGQNKSVYIFGAQYELGSYVSSYIPCMGTSETRAADSCSVTGVSDVIGQTEGTMFAEFKIPEKQTPSFFSISSGSAANRIIFGYYNGNLTYFVNSTTGSFFTTGIIDNSPVVGQTYKIALAYKNNDFKAYKNGTNTNTETTFTVPASLTAIDNQGGGANQFIFAEVNQFMLFKERLTNSELATLTTL